ncbi:MAG: glycosyltransferase family 2 protein [Victivallaceae bacterium]|nr:glycosyltransferase family 2 protein [Victivallaceae bacterium]
MKFSIITPVLNAAATIERTIVSVLEQQGEVEYLVIDGGSTDGTQDVVGRYRDRIAYFQSRPDRGLYDAMNQGIMHSTGDIVGIINADDWYFPGAVELARGAFESSGSGNAVFWGDVEYEHQGRVRGYRPWKLGIGAFAPHPSMFVPRKMYDLVGVYDLAYKYLADYDFMYRAVRNFRLKVIYSPRLVAHFSESGLSGAHVAECLREEYAIHLAHGMPPWRARLMYELKLLKNRHRIRP